MHGIHSTELTLHTCALASLNNCQNNTIAKMLPDMGLAQQL